MVTQNIDILLIEDSKHDAELALIVLERAGYEVAARIVHDRQGMDEALRTQRFDLVISDYVLPSFSGSEALQIAREYVPETPFLFFSGVFGEAHAVEMMRMGATDYVLKQNLSLLPKAVDRALSEVRERRERNRIETELRELELQSRLAIDAARLGVWDLDPRTGRLMWDERCRQLLELEPGAEPSIAGFLKRCRPDDRARLMATVRQAMEVEGTGDYQEQYRVRLPGGRHRWISTRGRALFQDGQCVRFTGVVMDVTSERLATQALEQQNEALGERVELRTRERDRTWALSRDILTICDSTLRPTAVNPAWRDVLGWTESQILGHSFFTLVHPDDMAATHRVVDALGQGTIISRFVNRLRHADGSYRWISWSAVPENDVIYASGRDITRDMHTVEELAAANRALTEQIDERERVEAALRQMQRLEAVGQLTAGVAHDFNNLLVVILSSAALLERDIPPELLRERASQRLRNIREAGERGAKLTAQLLAFARRQQLEPRVIDLNEAITAMLGLLQSTLGTAVTIETSFDPAVRPALADPTQLELIVLNLVINARDAMPEGGRLMLSTSNCTLVDPPQRAEEPEPGEYIVLEVTDSGTGMTPEVLAKAFEPFFTTKDVGKGSGLGLAQVFGFAKQTGGGARITTVHGQGTTVTVFLPMVPGGQPTTEAVIPGLAAGTQIAGPVRTVLLVDDDDAVREVTAILLEDLGCDVIQASTGQAALEILRSGRAVDVLMTDFAMPRMNGAELARAARALDPTLPLIFVTGYAELRGLEIPDAQLLQKPFGESDLMERVQRATREPG
ncbi:response regulator [Achromobacter sp. GG226]|uniref:hybrid sensor histidine kinase/response regulator n=1 Tax=Verticiella alkaliphila TaxID=2779529 RepID=UPI001C0B06C5|nr:hybrid sensor histidine kinase/response regulator [Verticiella sp. GG226]MBU4610209.1 response regulator [Verticiella sp. GG226]